VVLGVDGIRGSNMVGVVPWVRDKDKVEEEEAVRIVHHPEWDYHNNKRVVPGMVPPTRGTLARVKTLPSIRIVIIQAKGNSPLRLPGDPIPGMDTTGSYSGT